MKRILAAVLALLALPALAETTIVTRASKGSALTFAEVDANFTNLKATADSREVPLTFAARLTRTVNTIDLANSGVTAGSCTNCDLTIDAYGRVTAKSNGSAGGGSSSGSALQLGDGAGGFTAYGGTSCTNQFPRSLSSTGAATCATVANTDLANSAITIAGTSTALGGTITQDTITGLSSTGLVKRTGSNALAIASAGTDYVAPGGALGTPSSGVATNLTGTASGLTAGNVTTNANLTGDVTSSGNATTLATVNSNVGTFGSATKASVVTVNAKGLVTAASESTVTPAVGSITGLGTGVATALGNATNATGGVVTVDGTATLTNKTLTSPTISGGTHTALTSLGIRSTGSGAFDLTLANTENLTAGRTLTITVNDAARTLNLGGNLTTAAAFTTSGANALTLTTTGSTNVTLPTSGTLAILGANTFTAGQTIQEAVGSSGLTLTGATQTTSQPVINATQTWNGAGVAFTAIKLNVTATAALAASPLMDLQIGSSSRFIARSGYLAIRSAGVSEDSNFRIQTQATGTADTDGFSIGVEDSSKDVYLNQRESAVMRFYVNGGERLTISGTAFTFGSGVVTPASSGTRYLCISTTGVVSSSASACSGT